MFKEKDVSKEKFDALLKWLDINRDQAGVKYELLRSRLINIFLRRGCIDPETVADEAFSRVAQKFPELGESYHGEPGRFVYAVAQNVYKEWLRNHPKTEGLLHDPAVDIELENAHHDCLDTCLQRLPIENRTMILEYYRGDGATKIENRTELAVGLAISMNALHVRALRVRKGLRDCIENCVERKNS